MKIDWWTLGLQTINVLVLIWLLSRFLFRPVATIVKERQQAISKLLDEAHTSKAEAEAEKEKAAEEVANLAASRSETLRAAASEADVEKAAILAAARADADRLRAAAEAEIASARQGEATAAADRASRLAVDIAAKLLDRLPDAARVTGFIEGLSKGLAALPEASRASIGADGVAVRVLSARALTDAESQACRSMLAQALGRHVEMTVEVDPALIAGLEIDTPHAAIRNSFRADLDRITTELTRHESIGG
ncbi:F0F1 ATP synthase subunit delta [Mesorhizobium sp. BAC0120]|uniref:F0F1 ATP synthase subunit delta n=1 Tax=Mesorhizobium sp. BAC0120 TaxID=3090670 RepID=UPI00298CA812|nr:F0F1 ATP synthase subunit delta [Mesorhizobium sp. BAC0120]MDW6024401.1 F0F1 ATP synthase subunit delta [Mesorhizobium sp. BAC0120]